MTYQQRVSRNLGFVADFEQARLQASTVAIAGAGGDGGRYAVSLARLGVGHFKLADPESFEIENTNRQAGCNVNTIGRNKAEVVAELVREINPQASVEVYPAGIGAANIANFVSGADVVADETEFTDHAIGVLLARQARASGVPVVMGLNIGFGALVVSFDPNGVTFEEYLGIEPDERTEDDTQSSVPLWRWVPKVPLYVSDEALTGVVLGTISAPSVAPGVDLCAGLLATETLAHITGIREPVLAPECILFDAVDLTMTRITDRFASFNESLSQR